MQVAQGMLMAPTRAFWFLEKILIQKGNQLCGVGATCTIVFLFVLRRLILAAMQAESHWHLI